MMLSKKLSKITPSVTIGISTKVKQLNDSGIDIINLSIGEPDFFTPDTAKNFGIDAINDNITKYDLVTGLKELRLAIKQKLEKENNIIYDIDDIVVSSGAKHALSNSLMALLDPGDEVILPKPFWVSYSEIVKLVGGVPILVDTSKDNNFKLTAQELKNSISDKTKVLLINNPSNPTGAIYKKDELQALVEICLENNIFIMSDEVYEKIRYNDDFVSVASLSDDAKNITITINGLSKSASMTGWRIGYTASSKEIAKAISTIQGHLVSHPSTVSQRAAYGALTQCEDDMINMVNIYRSRRDKAVELLSKIDKVSYINPEGAFYLFIDISKLKDKIDFKDSLSIEFCNKFLDEYRVALVPGIAFGLDDYVRISYACEVSVFTEGINRLEKFVNSLY